MSDAKTAAIEAAKAAAKANPLLIGPDGKATPTAIIIAGLGAIGALIGGVEDVYYTDARGVVRCARHILSIFKARAYAMTEEVNDDNRPVMDLTGEIDKIVGERIYAEVEREEEAKWRERRMKHKPIEPEDAKHAAHPQPGVGGPGYTLCHQAFQVGCEAFAKKHEPITCEKCLEVIRMCRDIERWRVV